MRVRNYLINSFCPLILLMKIYKIDLSIYSFYQRNFENESFMTSHLNILYSKSVYLCYDHVISAICNLLEFPGCIDEIGCDPRLHGMLLGCLASD